MSRERYEAVKELHARALDTPPPQRAALLASCADLDVREEVEALLAYATDSRAFLAPREERLPTTMWLEGVIESVPSRIGEYDVVRMIGKGGMGNVYEAQQETPHRRVALKVIRPDLAL